MQLIRPMNPSRDLHVRLSDHNHDRLEPVLTDVKADWTAALLEEAEIARLEGEWIESERQAIAPHIRDVPRDCEGFLKWFGF
jgi:hypothetical protein